MTAAAPQAAVVRWSALILGDPEARPALEEPCPVRRAALALAIYEARLARVVERTFPG